MQTYTFENCTIWKKNDFFSPASTVNKKNLGWNQSKIFLQSSRAGKNLQFGHQSYANWSIRSWEK